MFIGKIVNYFGKEAEVVVFDKTHCVIKFCSSKSRLCTQISTFNKNNYGRK